MWLKSGGYLVIDQTEALMAIDVNSGKFVGSSSLEDTTLRINLEAVQEVVAQLRLRNIGGIIIIDFIDMDRAQNRDKVYKALDEALREDRARTNVLRISDLGLVEMTRKRTQEGLDRYLMEDCPTCSGTGYVRSRSTLGFEITARSSASLTAARVPPASTSTPPHPSPTCCTPTCSPTSSASSKRLARPWSSEPCPDSTASSSRSTPDSLALETGLTSAVHPCG